MAEMLIRRPTGALRWMLGKLQQEYDVSSFENGQPISHDTWREWHDVPGTYGDQVNALERQCQDLTLRNRALEAQLREKEILIKDLQVEARDGRRDTQALITIRAKAQSAFERRNEPHMIGKEHGATKAVDDLILWIGKTEAERDKAQREWADAQSTMAKLETERDQCLEEVMGLRCQLDAIQETAHFVPKVNVDLKDPVRPLTGFVHYALSWPKPFESIESYIMACGASPYEMKHFTEDPEKVTCLECLEWLQAGDSCQDFGRLDNCLAWGKPNACTSCVFCSRLWRLRQPPQPVVDLDQTDIEWIITGLECELKRLRSQYANLGPQATGTLDAMHRLGAALVKVRQMKLR